MSKKIKLKKLDEIPLQERDILLGSEETGEFLWVWCGQPKYTHKLLHNFQLLNQNVSFQNGSSNHQLLNQKE